MWQSTLQINPSIHIGSFLVGFCDTEQFSGYNIILNYRKTLQIQTFKETKDSLSYQAFTQALKKIGSGEIKLSWGLSSLSLS